MKRGKRNWFGNCDRKNGGSWFGNCERKKREQPVQEFWAPKRMKITGLGIVVRKKNEEKSVWELWEVKKGEKLV